jgi:flagellar secretion chaperone FliS
VASGHSNQEIDMNATARDEYLTTEVLTAAPQKLRLMLIEAALRFGWRADARWKNGENEAALDDLIHAQEAVTQLISGLSANLESPLVRQVAAVYAFIYRSLVSAGFHRDPKKLADALRVLETERETWRQVCAKLESSDAGPSQALKTAKASPLVIDIGATGNMPYTGVSFEA